MSTTIRENIFEALKSILEGISISNYFENDIASVQRWNPNANQLVDTPAITITAGAESNEDSPNPLTTCTMSIFLDLFIRHGEDETTAVDTTLNSLLGDIKKAISENPTLNDYAIMTSFKNIMPFDTIEGQAFSGLIIELEILYRHKQTDPTSIG